MHRILTSQKIMKKTSFVIITILAVCTLFMQACKKSSSSGDVPADVCTTVTAKFTANVLPLMQTKCSYNSSCHGTGSVNSGGVLLTYAQISAKATTVKSQVAAGIMPQTGSMTTAEKNIIVCWVNSGAMNN